MQKRQRALLLCLLMLMLTGCKHSGSWSPETFPSTAAETSEQTEAVPETSQASTEASTQAPTEEPTEVPTQEPTEVPTEASTEQAPPQQTQPPVTQPPATQPPATQPPVTQPPVTQPPVTQPPVTEPPVTQPPAPTLDAAAYQAEVFRLVNEARAAEGLPSLTYRSDLQGCADVRAKELTVLFSHTRPDGSSCFSVIDQANIPYFTVGENIAQGTFGYVSPAVVMQGWMNSEGHRANILGEQFTGIAVGCTVSNGVICWVQIFIG